MAMAMTDPQNTAPEQPGQSDQGIDLSGGFVPKTKTRRTPAPGVSQPAPPQSSVAPTTPTTPTPTATAIDLSGGFTPKPPGFFHTLGSNISGLWNTLTDAPGPASAHLNDQTFGWNPGESGGMPVRDPEFTSAMEAQARKSGLPFQWKGSLYNVPAHPVSLGPIQSAIESTPALYAGIGGNVVPIPNVLAPIMRIARATLGGSTQSAAQVQPLIQQGRYSEAAGHALATATPGGSIAESAGEEFGRGHYAAGAAHLTTALAPMAAAKVLPKVAGKVGSAVLSPLEKRIPRVVTIEGVNIPVLVGEAESPTTQSTVGAHQIAWKAEGIGARHFNRIAASQQAAVGEVINRVARNATGDLTPDEAAVSSPENFPSYSPASQSMRSATVVSALRSFPMYQALDTTLAHEPVLMGKINNIVRSAVDKAKKMGVASLPDALSDLSPENSQMAQAESAYQQALQQYKINPNSSSALQLRHSMGLPVDSAEGAASSTAQQPMQNYMIAKAHLYNYMDPESTPGSSAPSAKSINVIRNMDAQIEQTIRSWDNPQLLKNWQDAGRTWTRISALRQVTDALERASTEGTPVQHQAAGLAPRVPEISGASLVDSLNALDFRGQLRQAFSPAQVTALRNVADILDRAQEAKAGNEASIKLRGYSTHSIVMHGIIDLVRHVGAAPAIRLMTSDINEPGGQSIAQFVNRMTAARNPAAAQAAVMALKTEVQKQYPTESFGGSGTPPTSTPPSTPPAGGGAPKPGAKQSGNVVPMTPPPLPSLADLNLNVNVEPTTNGVDLELSTPRGQAVGTMFLRQHAPVNGMQASEIGSVNLSPSQQGAGIGQAFIVRGAQHAIDQGDGFLVVNQPTQELSRSLRVLQARFPGELTAQHTAGTTQWTWDLQKMQQRLAGGTPSAAPTPTITTAPTAPYGSVGQRPGSAGVQMPAPPPARAITRPSAQPMSQAARSAAAIAVMTSLKNGEINQQEADRRIQKITGGGGRRMIRMPQDPRYSAQ